MKRLLLTALAIAAVALPARAQVVYENGPPVIARGVPIDFAPVVQPFVLTDAISFNTLGIYFAQAPATSLAFIPFNYSFSSGGSVLFSGTSAELFRTMIGSILPGFDAYYTRIALGPRALGPGSYTLTLDAALFSIEGTLVSLPTAAQDPLAFQLLAVSTVPEPASLALMATGLVGLLGVVSRRRAVALAS